MSTLLISSCSGDNTISQCNLLIEALNQTEGSLASITESSSPNIEAIAQIASTTQSAAANLEAVELRNSTLKGFQNRFQEFYTNMSNDAQAMVKAYEEQNLETAETAYGRLTSTFEQQETLINDVNQYCNESQAQ